MFFVAKAVGKRDALSLPLFQAHSVDMWPTLACLALRTVDPRPPLPCLGAKCHVALASSCQSLSCWGAA